MRKGALSNIDKVVENYNEFNITNLQAVNNIKNSKYFKDMDKQLVYTVQEDGNYVIEGSGCKHYKINILSGVTCTIFEHTNGTNSLQDIEYSLNEDSNVYSLILTEDKTSYVSRKIELAKNAKYKVHYVGLGCETSQEKIIINLNDEGAEADFKLISVANEDTFNMYDVTINNNAPKTTANIWQKACVKSGGRNEFFATGFIGKDCSKSNNFQESRVLLLDKAATGDASPLLLINHHDVLAGHSASVSRVSGEELYYLQTRGITKNEAEKLMTIAFIRPLVDEIEDDELRSDILAKVESKLSI